jgi:hypothetical protein
MLTHLAATVPPRIGHLVARLLGISAALAMFCPCGTCGGAWGDE